MPCDSIILCQVELKLADKDLLFKALSNLASNVVVINDNILHFYYKGVNCAINNGKLICPQGYESIADDVKRAYSKECLIKATTKFGWQLKPNVKNPNKFQVIKRY